MWGQRLQVYVRSSFAVVTFHNLWSNHRRSTSMARYKPSVCKVGGNLKASPYYEGMAPMPSPVETPLYLEQKALYK